MQFRRISQGDGRLMVGVEWSVWNRLSMDIPDDLVVVSEVLMVLIFHSIKLLDLG